MDFGKLTLEELKQGYAHEAAPASFVCNHCGQRFESEQVYPMDGKFYPAEAAAKRHVAQAHGGAEPLIRSDSKYNALTDVQKDLLLRFAAKATDREIAKALSISEATVRRQRFNFREKAKQAKLYLAIYEQVFETEGSEPLMPIHNAAVFLDDRYVITQQERERILKNAFASQNPLVLKTFPPKEKKKIVILTTIAAQFEKGRRYTEQEVNGILKPIFGDFVTIRRFLIIYGLMSRTRSGAEYWLTE